MDVGRGEQQERREDRRRGDDRTRTVLEGEEHEGGGGGGEGDGEHESGETEMHGFIFTFHQWLPPRGQTLKRQSTSTTYHTHTQIQTPTLTTRV